MTGCINHSLRFGWVGACRARGELAGRTLTAALQLPAADAARQELVPVQPLQVCFGEHDQMNEALAVVSSQVSRLEQAQTMFDNPTLAFEQE
jgi:hypothetical protein